MAKKKRQEIELAESGVEFDAAEHRYWLDGRELQGITTTLVKKAYPHTYDDIPEDVLLTAAERGSRLHQAVGDYFTTGEVEQETETIVKRCAELLSAEGLTPLRFEYIVTDGEHFASPIDIVCEDRKGAVCIVDMKFTWQLHYQEVQLQTSIYRELFARQNPGLEASRLYVLWVATDKDYAVRRSRLQELQPCPDGMVAAVAEAYLSGRDFDVRDWWGELPATVEKARDYLRQLAREIKERQEAYDSIKAGLLEMMEAKDLKTYQTKGLTLTRLLPTVRVSIDVSRLRKELPDVAEKYGRVTETKAGIRLTFTDDDDNDNL